MLTIHTVTSSLPPLVPGVGGAAITGCQLLATFLSYGTETNPQTTAQYSKFVQLEKVEKEQKMISSKDGMTIIYLPAFVASLSILGLGFADIIPITPSLAGLLVNVHFLKRMYEVFYIHKYSGKVSQVLSTAIGTYYALISVLICCISTSSNNMNYAIVGTTLCLIGFVGNFYHHLKLSELRKGSTPSAKYVAPSGGLFSYAAAPHYLFELIGWLGIAIASEHGNAFLVFTAMTSYLSGRSVAQNKWNRDNFSEKDWPVDRKNIVPFIF